MSTMSYIIVCILTYDMYRLDEGLVGSGMGLSLIVSHWLKSLPQKLKRSLLNVCTVYV
jgi:hypothetical protein